ncbi:hypothetical protein ACG7TL_007658 [Trametes sanguinea]
MFLSLRGQSAGADDGPLAVDPNEESHHPIPDGLGVSRTPSIPTQTGASTWAFSAVALPSTTTSNGALASTRVVAASATAGCAEVGVNENTSCDDTQGIEDGQSEPVYDDEWEDYEATGIEEPPLPPVLTSPSSHGQSEPSNAHVPSCTSPRNDSDPPRHGSAVIQLNTDAMARIDEPDPFASPLPAPDPPIASTFKSGHPVAILVMLLVTWLHLTAHLPFRFCDVVLTVIGFILAEAGQSYPTCPDCLKVYPERVAEDVHASCLNCGRRLFKEEGGGPSRRRKCAADRAHAKPYLRTPAKSLTEQLALLLKEPGFEDALSMWRKRARAAGQWNDFFDGAVSRELLGPDGRPFFRHDLAEEPDDELRIGVAMGVDWFSYLRSQISPSYSSCPISFNIVNLPPHLRYRANNLLLSMIIPGPKESDPDQTQNFLGILPAAHKLGGYASHTHTFFCTRDWVSQGQKASKEAFQRDGFRARTDQHHRRLMEEYRKAPTKSAREEHAAAYATRWSELARLPYFDFHRMIVVDPMHNLFLVVGPLALPELWSGCYRSDVNHDQEFFRERCRTIQQRVAIRKAAQKAKKKAREHAEHNRQPSERSMRDETTLRRSNRARKPTEKARELVLDEDDAGALFDDDDTTWDDEDDEEDGPHDTYLHERDLATFLKLCRALRIFLSDSISDEQLTLADQLIREYCQELVELYGPDMIRPNHHYATHTADCVRDYGPLRGYWTFIFERLNKILKTSRTNNHEGGEIETTFFREFHRAAQLQRMLSEGLRQPVNSVFYQTCHRMQEATSDGRGTLQQLVEELEEAHGDDNILLSFSPRSARQPLDEDVYYALLTCLQVRYPTKGFHSDICLTPHAGSIMLSRMATVFDYVVVAGYRYYAASRSNTAVNSLALIRTSEAGTMHVGQVEHIVHYECMGHSRELFAYVRWLKPAGLSLTGTPWADCEGTFMLQTWHTHEFLDPAVEPAPSSIVPLYDLLSPVACRKTTIHGQRCHLTMPIARNPIQLI